jgi:hypothetical protein
MYLKSFGETAVGWVSHWCSLLEVKERPRCLTVLHGLYVTWQSLLLLPHHLACLASANPRAVSTPLCVAEHCVAGSIIYHLTEVCRSCCLKALPHLTYLNPLDCLSSGVL